MPAHTITTHSDHLAPVAPPRSPQARIGQARIGKVLRRLCASLAIVSLAQTAAFAQKAFTWQEIRDKFQSVNPTLRAFQLSIDESRAQEITAYLRPNPNFTAFIDQINPFKTIPS